MGVDLGDVVKPAAGVSSKVVVAGTANTAQAMAKGSRANASTKMRFAEMHSAEMHSAEVAAASEVTASTVAASTMAAAATATACKGAGRETQCANGDTRQQRSCHVGHHDSLHRTVCVHATGPSCESMFLPGSDLSWIAVLDTSLRQW
jgi:hypothetical protein